MAAELIVDRIDIYKLSIERSETTKTPIGIADMAANVAVKLIANNGEFGWGEASPFEPITGDSQDSNFVTAQQLAKLVKGKNPLAIDARMREIDAVTVGQPSIRSAFCMALYDIAAKTAKMPLYQFLGGEYREIKTDMTIGLQDTVEDTINCAKTILNNGFDAIKMKVGRTGTADWEHVKAVRELTGPDIIIRIDSNQGWDYPTARSNIKTMESLQLQYSEQPLAYWDYTGLLRLRSVVDLPICADESLFDDKDALDLIKKDAVDYLNIKLGKAGGIGTALKINAIAEAAGCKCMIGCFAESRLALSAAAHLAVARPNIHFIDLDAAYKQQDDPVRGGVSFDPMQGGLLQVPDNPGHGAEFDPVALDQQHHVSIY